MTQRNLSHFLLGGSYGRRIAKVVYIVKISEQYFTDNPELIEVMDIEDGHKKRIYLGVIIEKDNNNFFIPFRTNTPSGKRYHKSIYPIPSNTRQHAGLDMRKALLVNNKKYVMPEENPQIASTKMKILENNIKKIEKMFSVYVNGYKKDFSKFGQVTKRFTYSTLQNYHLELGLNKLPEKELMEEEKDKELEVLV